MAMVRVSPSLLVVGAFARAHTLSSVCLVSDSGAGIKNLASKVNGHRKYRQDVDVWKEAPILIGTTKFEPRPEVKNIMVTGGAGFM